MLNRNTKLLIALFTAAVAAETIPQAIAEYGSDKTVTFTVADKQYIRPGLISPGAHVVLTEEGEVFQVKDTTFRDMPDAQDMYRSLRVGQTYEASVYGFGSANEENYTTRESFRNIYKATPLS